MLDKAKLEKKVASLEGERKSFNKGKRDSETKLQNPNDTTSAPIDSIR